MKYISFNKFKSYLETYGYTIENSMNVWEDLRFYTYFFSKPNEKEKFAINVFMNKDNTPGDYVISINKGYGSIYLGWHTVKPDMRTKFWKQFIINN